MFWSYLEMLLEPGFPINLLINIDEIGVSLGQLGKVLIHRFLSNS